ncbi:hypothetical protein BKA82DRAFT_4019518 [Pisolithus tinctorius]|nr:hypothetical protein BKA82DRAFT_4019518 [Pisolithus tinctorius]
MFAIVRHVLNTFTSVGKTIQGGSNPTNTCCDWYMIVLARPFKVVATRRTPAAMTMFAIVRHVLTLYSVGKNIQVVATRRTPAAYVLVRPFKVVETCRTPAVMAYDKFAHDLLTPPFYILLDDVRHLLERPFKVVATRRTPAAMTMFAIVRHILNTFTSVGKTIQGGSNPTNTCCDGI